MGYPVLDSVASAIICLFIIKVAIAIFRQSAASLVDQACDSEFEKEVAEFILAQEGVMGIDSLRTRLFGNKIFIDAEIVVDGELTLRNAHSIAERVHDGIEAAFPAVKHVMIHVNPNEQ